MSNDKKALIALMDLVLALADFATTPPGHRNKIIFEVRSERREVAGWRETLHLLRTEANRQALEASIRQARAGSVVADGQAARTAVAATERRMRAWYGLEGLRREMDKSVVDLGANREPIEDDAREWHIRNGVDPIEADDNRLTQPQSRILREVAEAWDDLEGAGIKRGHKCCGGKPDCGCARSVGG